MCSIDSLDKFFEQTNHFLICELGKLLSNKLNLQRFGLNTNAFSSNLYKKGLNQLVKFSVLENHYTMVVTAIFQTDIEKLWDSCGYDIVQATNDQLFYIYEDWIELLNKHIHNFLTNICGLQKIENIRNEIVGKAINCTMFGVNSLNGNNYNVANIYDSDNSITLVIQSTDE